MGEITQEQVVSYLSSLPVIDMAGLVKRLEKEWGVSAAAPVAMAASAAPAAGEPAEEKTEFTVHLVSFGDKKINVIKTVRELIPGLGLKEAKELVEGVPANIKEGVGKEEGQEMVKKLNEAGGQAELK
jgi:large subunit ribosomal protein L7/L12